MAAKKVALFVDAESMHAKLRSLHHRALDPEQVLESASAHGKLVSSTAVGSWSDLPSGLEEAFEDAGYTAIGVERVQRSPGGRRRAEVLRDTVDLELLALMVEALFPQGGPNVDRFVLATSDEVAVRIVSLLRERFDKDVFVIGVEGALSDALAEAASESETLPMPALEPQDLEGLERLVPMLEELEKRKRYLNFKYIRESVVRRLDLPDRSFEAAERLLSDAIACGLLLKRKIEDKYNPGQLFTAYALERDHELFDRFGSGDPAPVHEDKPEAAGPSPSIPSLGRAKAKAAPAAPEPSSKNSSNSDRGNADEEDGRGRRRRRRRRKSKEAKEAEVVPTQLAAGGIPGKKKNKKKRRGRNNQHQQDRVGRTYEAPSRFLMDESAEQPTFLSDDEIDEERILRARGD